MLYYFHNTIQDTYFIPLTVIILVEWLLQACHFNPKSSLFLISCSIYSHLFKLNMGWVRLLRHRHSLCKYVNLIWCKTLSNLLDTGIIVSNTQPMLLNFETYPLQRTIKSGLRSLRFTLVTFIILFHFFYLQIKLVKLHVVTHAGYVIFSHMSTW